MRLCNSGAATPASSVASIKRPKRSFLGGIRLAFLQDRLADRHIAIPRLRRSLSRQFFANRPEFLAGALEVGLERAHVKPTVTVEERTAEGYRLFVRW